MLILNVHKIWGVNDDDLALFTFECEIYVWKAVINWISAVDLSIGTGVLIEGLLCCVHYWSKTCFTHFVIFCKFRMSSVQWYVFYMHFVYLFSIMMYYWFVIIRILNLLDQCLAVLTLAYILVTRQLRDRHLCADICVPTFAW